MIKKAWLEKVRNNTMFDSSLIKNHILTEIWLYALTSYDVSLSQSIAKPSCNLGPFDL